MLILVTGCLFYPDPPAPDSAPFFEGDTAITSVDWTCSAEDDTWTFRIATEGWTGGGLLSMSDDGLRIEAHEVLTLEAAADGSTEELLLELEIEADPQLVVSGRSTRHLCNADTRAALAYRLVVYEAFENGVADCRVWGQELDWNAAAGYSVCDTRLE